MDLTALYNQYQGTSIASFDGNPANNGQCEQWALMVRTKREGLPIRYGNAIDWWTDRGDDVNTYDYIAFAPGVYPQSGDYVVWGSGVGSSAGHIDLCAVSGTASGFTGYDSNWEDIPKLTIIQHNYEFGILGYIRLKGEDMADDQQVQELQSEVDLARSQAVSENQTIDSLTTELTAERAGYQALVTSAQAIADAVGVAHGDSDVDQEAVLAAVKSLQSTDTSMPTTSTDPSVTVTETGLWAAFKRIFGL